MKTHCNAPSGRGGVLKETARLVCVLVLSLCLSTLALGQATQEGNGGGFEIDDCGTLFSGTGNQATPVCTTNLTCTNIPLGDDWAQGPSFHGVLDNNGQPTTDPNTGDPYRAELFVDQNWGNNGDGADATQFGGVSNKNNDPIGDPLIYTGQDPWNWNGTGGGPQKNDLTNTYIHTRTDPNTGHIWVILAAETRATNGDSHVDFEFNLAGLKLCDSTETTCSGPGGSPPPGTTAGLIIGRGPDDGRTVDKDFIVSIDFTQGGVIPNAVVRIWTETSPGVFSYQTATSLGIDTTGKVFSSTNICTITHDTSGGAWHHFTGDGAPTSTMLAFQMVETAIDLTGLGIDVNPCSPDATIMVKTRSSQSFTAELKDFALAQFPLNPIPQCEITGPALVCPGEQNITYTVAETTGLTDATFDWTIAGNATFCGGGTTATGPSVCVDADNVCNASFQLIVTVTVGPCSSTCLLMVDVNDDTPPLITCPGPVTVQCHDDVPGPNTSLVTASDNCGSPTVTWEGDVSDGNTCPEIITRTYRATDGCGNHTDCTQLITVDDTIPPAITCPGPVTVQCHGDIPASDTGSVIATDNCGTPVVTWQGDVSDGNTCPETITRTYRATDACGNTADCTQTIVVNDTIAPQIIECAPDITIECSDPIPPPDPNSVHAIDNCSTPTVVWFSDQSNGQTCPETILRTYRVSDACGNFDDCGQLIVIRDTTPPVITCPPTITVQCRDDVPDPNLNRPAATDNCSTPTVRWVEDDSDGQTCPETITRIYAARDACFNQSRCYQTIVVDDTTPPVITCPPPISVQCRDQVPPPSPGVIPATDNCGIPEVFWDGDHSDGQSCPETIARVYRAVDDCGNATTCTQTIVVNDTIPPFIECPPPIDIPCQEPIPPPAPFDVIATDNCGIPHVTWLRDDNNGQHCPEVITRFYVATDDCGNTATCSQIITRFDNTPPEISCPPALVVQCPDDVPPPNTGSVLAFDTCSTVTVTWLGDHSNGQTCPEIITRTYQATDRCGNFSRCDQLITVFDTTPPQITCPPDVNLECTQTVPPPDPGSVIATDNCSTPVVTWQGDHSDGNTCPETITRIYRATDACGNFAECVQHLVIGDSTPPTITCPGNIDATCTQTLDIVVTASDNCDTTPAITSTFTSGDLSAFVVQEIGNGHYTVTTSAATSITVTSIAYDECGNASQPCSFVITITCGNACSPGYWKQTQHFHSWCDTGYQPVANFCGPGPATKFVDAFQITNFSSSEIPATFDVNMTLLQAVSLTGGSFNQALFQGSAALLNAADPNVSFGASVAQVQKVMQDAFAGTITFKQAATQFAAWNAVESEGGCPLN